MLLSLSACGVVDSIERRIEDRIREEAELEEEAELAEEGTIPTSEGSYFITETSSGLKVVRVIKSPEMPMPQLVVAGKGSLASTSSMAIEIANIDVVRDQEVNPCNTTMCVATVTLDVNGLPQEAFIGTDIHSIAQLILVPDGLGNMLGIAGGERFTGFPTGTAAYGGTLVSSFCPSSYKMGHQSGLSIGGSGSFV